jgi:hypothetical protein
MVHRDFGGAMLRLTTYDHDEEPTTLLFPTHAARLLRSGLVEAENLQEDADAMDAATRVEAAMKGVELHFDRLRHLAGFPDVDPDRPRAA